MFKGFGDPFKDDPFFNGSGGGLFGGGGIDQMMKDMNKNMMDVESGFGSGKMGGAQRFSIQTYNKSTKIGPDGKPVSEVYQTKT